MSIGQWNPFLRFYNLLQNAIAGSDNVDSISAQSALSYPAIWYGVNKIAGHIAQLPLGVYHRLERGAERDRKHPVAQLMRRPNPYQTSVIFREQIAVHAILQGNGRAAIVKQNGIIKELIPLHPDCTSTGMLAGQKLHATRPARDDRLRLFFDTVTTGEPNDPDGIILLLDEEVLHVPGLTLDGVSGLPLIEAAKQNLAISLASEKRLNSQMDKGFQGNIMLNAPPGVFRKQQDALEYLEWFEKRHHEKENAGKPGLLREGITAEILAMNNTDAQFAEQRLFQRQDAALWLGLEQILGDDSSVSYNSLEQKTLAYLMNTLNRWLKRIEEELEVKLLPAPQFRSDEWFIRFNTAALLKADYKTTIEALSLAVTSTIISRNEAREVLDRNPVDGGDDFSNPAITPGTSSNEADSQFDEESDESDMTTAAARNAIKGRLEHLIGVESRRVTKASRSDNFSPWLDEFYTKWQDKLSIWLSEMGLDPELAAGHCVQSHKQLTEASQGASDTEQAVSDCVSDWKQRAALLMEADCHVCS